MLILPPSDRGSKFQRSKSCFRRVSNGGKLALKRSLKSCVIQIPKYLNVCLLTLKGNESSAISVDAVFIGMISLFCRLIL